MKRPIRSWTLEVGVRIRQKHPLNPKWESLDAMSPNGLPGRSVARPSKWGNSYMPENYSESERVKMIEKYWDRIQNMNRDRLYNWFIDPLIGYNLGCYCRLDEPCHADILLKIVRERVEYLRDQKTNQNQEWIRKNFQPQHGANY